MTLKLAKPTGASFKLAKPTGAKLLMRPAWQPMDPDAAAYITAVETADGQALEEKTKIAIDNFVLGCKADGIWPAIKASCILAGARTLSGALVPLVGAAPTNNNFVSGNYSRKTGLVGDGSTKYLNSNRNNNADPQNSNHLAVYSTQAPTATTRMAYAGCGIGDAGSNQINAENSSTTSVRCRSSTTSAITANDPTGLIGANRSNAASFVTRITSNNASHSVASQSPFSENIYVFQRGAGSPSRSNSRLAFYSIGESLDLALLDARVTDLINAFAAAIP